MEQKVAIVDLGDGIDGQLRASEIARDRVDDVRLVLKEGQAIEARFVGVDRKNRVVSLSIKAKEAYEEAEAMKDYQSSESSGATLGDLLRQQMDAQKDD